MRRALAADDGLVAIEFGIVVSVLVPLLLATADTGQYLRRRLQAEGVAASATRAVAAACVNRIPAVRKCGRLDAVVADIAAAGGQAAVAVDEAEFCVVRGRLVRVGKAGAGVQCASQPATPAGDYLRVTATVTVEPLFMMGSVLPRTIVRTAIRRLA